MTVSPYDLVAPETEAEAVVIALYIENDLPSDQYSRAAHTGTLEEFARRANQKISPGHTPSEYADMFIRLRKQGKLPRLGRRYKGPTFTRED